MVFVEEGGWESKRPLGQGALCSYIKLVLVGAIPPSLKKGEESKEKIKTPTPFGEGG